MSGTRAPKTIVVYDITGQTDYTIPFEYLARKFVVVTLIGQDRKVLTLNTDYRFTTRTTIGLSDANPAGYDKIEIRRFTSATDRLVDFHDGSILRAYDLNLSQIQTLHVAEEARDLAGDSIAVDDKGNLDARGRRIVNLSDAIDDLDAVNLGQLKEFDSSTFNNAQLAKASADAAKVSETKAKASENRAVTAETRAVASAGTAVQAAMDANASKVDAKTSEVNSKISETNAKTSETNAKDSEIKAELEASKLQSYNDIALALKPITTESVHFNRDLEVTDTTNGATFKVTQIKEDVDGLTTRVETLEEWPQSGSNENGKWVKHKDGTLICYHNIVAQLDMNTTFGALFTAGSYVWTFPSIFVGDVPTVSVSETGGVGNCFGGLGNEATSLTKTSWRLYRPEPVNSKPRASLIAIGRWK